MESGGHGSGIGEAHGSWLHGLVRLINETVGFRLVDDFVVVSWLVIVGLVTLAWAATRRREMVPRGVQNFMEWVVESLSRFLTLVIGPEGPRYVPLIGTLFIYIFCLNLTGLIPGLVSPTASLNTTISLAVVTIIMVQYYGIKKNGLWGYIRHFIGEPWWFFPINIPMHMISEYFARPLSLAVRLFGNIFGEDTVMVQVALLGAAGIAVTKIPLPVHLPILAFGLFTSFVQALVFSMLTGVYIALITAHAGEEHAHSH